MKRTIDPPRNNRLAALVAVAALLLAGLYWAVSIRLDRLDAAMRSQQSAANELIQRYASREQLANDIRLHAEQSEGKLSLIFFIASKERRMPIYGEMDGYNAMVDRSLERLAPLLQSTEERQLLARLQAVRNVFRDNMQETVDALELNDRTRAEALLTTIARDNLQEIRSLVDRLASLQQSALSALQKDVVERENETGSALLRSRAVTIGLGLAAAFFVLILGGLLGRRWARAA